MDSCVEASEVTIEFDYSSAIDRAHDCESLAAMKYKITNPAWEESGGQMGISTFACDECRDLWEYLMLVVDGGHTTKRRDPDKTLIAERLSEADADAGRV